LQTGSFYTNHKRTLVLMLLRSACLLCLLPLILAGPEAFEKRGPNLLERQAERLAMERAAREAGEEIVEGVVEPTSAQKQLRQGSQVPHGEDSEWGMWLLCTKAEARVHLYHWPAGGEPWVHRKEIREFDYETPHHVDPTHHLLKSTKGISELVSMATRQADYGDVLSRVNETYAPLFERVALHVPEEKHNSTRVMLVVTHGLRQLSEAQQCPMWRAVRTVLRESRFHSGEFEFVSLASAYPHNARKCPELL
jgi:hypothetical protein